MIDNVYIVTSKMDVTFHNRMEEYYQRFIDLQEKLRKRLVEQ